MSSVASFVALTVFFYTVRFLRLAVFLLYIIASRTVSINDSACYCSTDTWDFPALSFANFPRKLRKGSFVVRFTTVANSKKSPSLVVLAADKTGDIHGMLLRRQDDKKFELTAPQYILGHCASIVTCMVSSCLLLFLLILSPPYTHTAHLCFFFQYT